MRLSIDIVSLNATFVTVATAEFGDRASCRLQDIREVDREGAAFVSPANSLGFMDGGIDAVLRDRFPGCEDRLKKRIRELGILTELGRPYLPVGSAHWQPVGPNTVLISAPTMFMPHDVSGTRNAYWAMMAALCAAADARVRRLVVPSLCCGWGRMSVTVAAAQMREALDDWTAGRRPTPVRDAGAGWILLPSRDAEQPANHDTREIGVGTYADGPVKEVIIH